MYKNGSFNGFMTMNEVLNKTGLRSLDLPNRNTLTEEDIRKASDLLPDVVKRAKEHLHEYSERYWTRMKPLLDEELDKLVELESKHKSYIQTSLFDDERSRDEHERMVDELFEKFSNWVTDALSIQDNPYIRIAAVLQGVA